MQFQKHWIKDVGTDVMCLVRHTNVVIGISNLLLRYNYLKKNAMKHQSMYQVES